jgi:hypothetical protein
MKTLLRLLIICCTVSSCFGASSVDEEKIRTQFEGVVQAVIDLDASSLVTSMHPDTVKSLAGFFRAELERRNVPTPTNSPPTNEAFVIEMVAEAFRVSPATFSFPTRNSIRVHGTVQDGEEAYLVYSTASEQPEFRSPATLTFRQDHGKWKLWSMPLARLVVATWGTDKNKGETQKVEDAP